MDKGIAVEMPAYGFVDELAREYSDIFGFTSTIEVPLGSLVTLLPSRTSDCYDYYNGLQGIVIARYAASDRPWRPAPRVTIRKLDNLSDWEPHCNLVGWDSAYVRIDKLGDNTAPVAGKDYPLCKRETLDLLWSKRDHRCNGWSNPATYTAHLYLRQSPAHAAAVRAMIRKDGTINPARLENYWVKHADLQIDEWARHGEGFPQISRYAYRVNWAEIAGEFEKLTKELHQFAALTV